MVKKFLFSAVALIGFTVASYGANTVEKLEVNESLLIEDLVSPCDDCYTNFNISYNTLRSSRYAGVSFFVDVILDIWSDCVEENCEN